MNGLMQYISANGMTVVRGNLQNGKVFDCILGHVLCTEREVPDLRVHMGSWKTQCLGFLVRGLEARGQGVLEKPTHGCVGAGWRHRALRVLCQHQLVSACHGRSTKQSSRHDDRTSCHQPAPTAGSSRAGTMSS